jgi:tetratricopeptide (TPR) repeat protein
MTILALLLVLCAGGTAWSVQEFQERQQRERDRLERAASLVQRAFGELTYVDYRDTELPRQLLDDAAELGAEGTEYRKARALLTLTLSAPAAVVELEAIRKQRPDDVESAYLLAWALFRMDRNEELERVIKEADDAGGPTTPAGHFFRGQALIWNHPEEAIVSFRKAIDGRQNFFQAMLHLGRAHNQVMYHDRKLEHFGNVEWRLRAACDGQSRKAYPRYVLSIAYRIAGEIYRHDGTVTRDEKKLFEAADHFKNALSRALEAQQVEPTSPRGYLAEAEYWESVPDSQSGQINYEAAIRARDRTEALSHSPNERRELYQYRSRLYYWSGQLDKARQDVDRFIGTHAETDSKSIWFSCFFPGLIGAELGDPAGAASQAIEAASRDPTSFRTVTTAAALLHVLGRFEDADNLLLQCAAAANDRTDLPRGAPDDWWRQVFELSQGHLGIEQVLQSTSGNLDSTIRAAPLFVAACRTLGSGDRTSSLKLFEACEQTYDIEDYCFMARLLARKMAQDPAWPPWLPKQPG